MITEITEIGESDRACTVLGSPLLGSTNAIRAPDHPCVQDSANVTVVQMVSPNDQNPAHLIIERKDTGV
ncbi:hypothetical protein [Nocardia jiangxiensis]|uniref:Uncharacterized protein n=1 Tax=Nocardia jiangxiensis TaxID=282685 RepID=A0ABW6S8U9_9NOCA|nr:hypothetical protein [Nocardia jiangxiensis]